jgi:hypothetical protein
MKQGNVRNHRPASTQLSAPAADLEPIGSGAGSAAAAKALYYHQIAQIVERYSTPTPTEPCLSPLLWSESFGLRLDG